MEQNLKESQRVLSNSLVVAYRIYSRITREILPIMGCLIFYPVLYVHTTKNKKNPMEICWEITENGPIIRRQISPPLVVVDAWVHCVVCCCWYVCGINRNQNISVCYPFVGQHFSTPFVGQGGGSMFIEPPPLLSLLFSNRSRWNFYTMSCMT